jgi:hypothetical protein
MGVEWYLILSIQDVCGPMLQCRNATKRRDITFIISWTQLSRMGHLRRAQKSWLLFHCRIIRWPWNQLNRMRCFYYLNFSSNDGCFYYTLLNQDILITYFNLELSDRIERDVHIFRSQNKATKDVFYYLKVKLNVGI